MSRAFDEFRRRLPPLAVGLAAVLAVLAFWAAGGLQRLELMALDLRFRHFSPHQPHPALLHVDIDDDSLERVGRWPWPREQQAALLATLSACGAELVVLDIILPEPQQVRYVSESHALYAGPDGATLGQTPPQPVYDDAILTAALQRCRTLVPIFLGTEARQDPRARLARRLLPALEANPAASLKAVAAAGGGDPNTTSPEELAAAYLQARSMQSIRRFALDGNLSGELALLEGTVIPPLAPFAEMTAASGFVSYQPDVDGVVRRVALLARDGNDVYPQLALAAAAATWGPGDSGLVVRARPGYLDVAVGDRRRRIPVDARGRMLIHWPAERVNQQWRAEHIPASAVLEVHRARSGMAANRARKRLVQLAILAQARHEPLQQLFAEADAQHRKLLAQRREHYLALLYRPAEVPPIDPQLQRAAEETERQIDAQWQAYRRDELEGFILAEVPDNPAARAQARAIRDRLAILDAIDQANADKAAFIESHLAELRRRVAGRVCLVGSTAAGAADLVVSPISARMPGVRMQSWALQTILSGKTLARAPAWADVAVLLGAGLLMAAVASSVSAPMTALVAGLLAAGYTLLNAAGLFGRGGLWVSLAGPLAAILAALLAVTLYRQLTEQRDKRRIRGLFAHALSPQLVDRLIEDPSVARLGGEYRDITCLFSDLAGFTPLAERLGAEGAVGLLQRYFDCMTEVIQQTGGGYLNKFLGDGIFCFFGAPVEQPDHPGRALRAAVDCQAEVGELNARLADQQQGHQELAVRIGLAAGAAVVGNCGSSRRMDYTAIGDSVNLAARLEAANKFFGTSILCSQATWDRAAAEDLLARPLGTVQVTGQSEPVAICEVLCRLNSAPAETVAACRQFAEAMEVFAAGQFDSAERLWQQVLRTRPDDGPAKVYLQVLHDLRAHPEKARSSAGWATGSGKGVECICWPWSA